MKTVSYTKTFTSGWMKGIVIEDTVSNASDTFIEWAIDKERTQKVVKPSAGSSSYKISNVKVN